MSGPGINDDGQTVELDLHGAAVNDAIQLVLRAVDVAFDRGRPTLRVIHGSSTSDPLAQNRTIKHALQEQLNHGIQRVTTHYMMEDVTILSIEASSQINRSPITLFDLR